MMKIKQKKKLELDEGTSFLDPSARENIYDEVDDYNDIGRESDENLSDSEDDVNALVPKQKRKEQVLGLDIDSSDEDGSEDYVSDEDEEGEDDDLLDTHEDIEGSENGENNENENWAMGKRKKDFYGTDITDQRLFNIERKKKKKDAEEDLQIELEGAHELQSRYRSNKAESFDFDVEDVVEERVAAVKEGQTEIEVSKSKSKQKKKISDLDDLAEEVREELQLKLIPLIEALEKHILPETLDSEYLRTRYFLCMNFMTTFSARKMLIAADTDLEGHSVEKRLVQFRELFNTMETCRKKFEPELDSLIDDLKSGRLKRKARKLLGVVKTKENVKPTKDEKLCKRDVNAHINMRNEKMNSDDGDSDKEEDNNKESDDIGVSTEGKRLITSEMAKNKGLMPSRKKEQRNPRVKYKNKYKNKLKRRKGQVREIRSEINRYGGEISGINKNVIKSIQLK